VTMIHRLSYTLDTGVPSYLSLSPYICCISSSFLSLLIAIYMAIRRDRKEEDIQHIYGDKER